RFLARDLNPPWPDIWIAAGRASLPLSLRVKRWSGHRTFVVQLQNPRIDPARFDMVIPPRHDAVVGAQVFSILGPPSRLTSDGLGAARAAFADRLAPLPGPRTAVLIGGRSKAFDLPAAQARNLGRRI